MNVYTEKDYTKQLATLNWIVNISSAVQCVHNSTAYTNEKSCLNEKHLTFSFCEPDALRLSIEELRVKRNSNRER